MTTSPSLKDLIAKWNRKFAEARAELEAKAAAGDVKAKYLLQQLDGEPVRERVNVPIPGPPPHWAEREPGEEG